MSQFTVILLIAIVGLIILFVWNAINFRALIKRSNMTNKELNDAKYWELKYKYEFTIAIVGIITATAGFFLPLLVLSPTTRHANHRCNAKLIQTHLHLFCRCWCCHQQPAMLITTIMRNYLKFIFTCLIIPCR
jgi:amino acid permease